MHHECVIIGGGVTGLSAAIRLTELGWKPLLIEAGDYPSHKVCGEFFSPECLTILKNWGIELPPITSLRWHTSKKPFEYCFPHAAGSLSHWNLDPLLLQKAELGGTTLLKTKVNHLRWDGKAHQIDLSTGETMTATQLIIATGRLPNLAQAAPKMLYKGIKAHFSGIPLTNRLEMFSFNRAYVGISPIEEGKCNVACLASIAEVERHGSVAEFMLHLMEQNSVLKAYLTQGTRLFDHWMSVSVPHFGIKHTPDWQQTYFIGDAAGTIPPATGNGLSMAITSGILAGEYVNRNDAIGFKNAWRARYRNQILWGKALHEIMMRPFLGNMLMKCGERFPMLADQVFRRTR